MFDSVGISMYTIIKLFLFLECPIGYHFINCSEKCNFPTFGEECQFQCDCPVSDCHFARGCVQNGDSDTNIQLKSMRNNLFHHKVEQLETALIM